MATDCTHKRFEQVQEISEKILAHIKASPLMKIPYVFIVQSFYNKYPMMVVLGSIWGI